MANEILAMIGISLALSFVVFLSAIFLINIGRIKHPKSKFLIYVIVIFTISAIIYTPFVLLSPLSSEGTSKKQNPCIDTNSPPVSLMFSYGAEEVIFQSPLETILTGASISSQRSDEKSATDNGSITSSLQRAVCISILYEKFFKNGNNCSFNTLLRRYDLQLDEKKIQQSSVSAILAEIIALQLNTSLSQYSSYPITCKFVLNSEQNKVDNASSPISIPLSQNNPPIHWAYIVSFSLILVGVIYFIFSLTIGKKMTLKTLNAKPCTDGYLLSIISDVSEQMDISMPKVFIAQGNPNAFVFGYPVTLVLSQNLLSLLTKKELEMTVRHELSHIKNKDILIKPLLQMLRIVFFFNPIIHFIVPRMLKERETMADVLSFSNKTDKITFMDALIKIEEYMILLPSKTRSIPLPSASSLLDHTKKQPSLEDRFNRLFEEAHPKCLLSISICLLLIVANLSIMTAAYQMIVSTQGPVEIMNTTECMPQNESYIYECTFYVGEDDIMCQEIVMFKSAIGRGSWIHYQTEILPLTPYLFSNTGIYHQPFIEDTHDPQF